MIRLARQARQCERSTAIMGGSRPARRWSRAISTGCRSSTTGQVSQPSRKSSGAVRKPRQDQTRRLGRGIPQDAVGVVLKCDCPALCVPVARAKVTGPPYVSDHPRLAAVGLGCAVTPRNVAAPPGPRSMSRTGAGISRPSRTAGNVGVPVPGGQVGTPPHNHSLTVPYCDCCAKRRLMALARWGNGRLGNLIWLVGWSSLKLMV
jgi:hypothetical protein